MNDPITTPAIAIAPSTGNPSLAASAGRVATVFNIFAGLSVFIAAVAGIFLSIGAEDPLPLLAAAIPGSLSWATFSFYAVVARYIEHRVA